MASKIKVSGIAVREGTSRNGVYYSAEELDKFSPTMINKPMLKDHEAKTDNVIGKVTNSFSSDGGKAVMFEGWVKEDGTGIIDKIKDGRISEVSISAMCGQLVKESEDSDILIARDMTCMELSTTPTPGVQGTNISQMIDSYESKLVSDEISDYLTSQESLKLVEETISHSLVEETNDIHNNYKEVKKMESTQENKIAESVISQEALELKAQLLEATKQLEAMKEAQRQEAISSYKAKCESKKVPAIDMSNMSMETIKALSATVDSFVIETKVEAKEVATSKTVEASHAQKSVDILEGYVIEHSTLGGLSFYKA